MKPIAIFKVMYEANWMENQMKRIEMKKKKKAEEITHSAAHSMATINEFIKWKWFQSTVELALSLFFRFSFFPPMHKSQKSDCNLCAFFSSDFLKITTAKRRKNWILIDLVNGHSKTHSRISNWEVISRKGIFWLIFKRFYAMIINQDKTLCDLWTFNFSSSKATFNLHLEQTFNLLLMLSQNFRTELRNSI